MLQQDTVIAAVKSILSAIGDDPSREGLKDTPVRVARMYEEIFSGIGLDPADAINTIFDSEEDSQDIIGADGMVIIRDIPFFSMCEHHLLPFHGRAHIGYVPGGKIAGVSKLARALDVVARRPQVQERMTNQIADAMVKALDPVGVGVVLEAEHLCMLMRGVRKLGSQVVTVASRGSFSGSATTPSEFLALLSRR